MQAATRNSVAQPNYTAIIGAFTRRSALTSVEILVVVDHSVAFRGLIRGTNMRERFMGPVGPVV
jgi:hypothetical protein